VPAARAERSPEVLTRCSYVVSDRGEPAQKRVQIDSALDTEESLGWLAGVVRRSMEDTAVGQDR